MWRKRYRHIRNFEQLLVDEGTTVVKLYLNISSEKQRQRLQDRVDSPDERWKFRLGDLEDRKLWAEYMKAFRDALVRTSTPSAPWYVIPADRKWVRNLAVAKILSHTIAQLDPVPRPPNRASKASRSCDQCRATRVGRPTIAPNSDRFVARGGGR